VSFKFHSNVNKAKRQLKDNEFAALKAVGEFVEGVAALLAPVDLGNLRGSITHLVDEGFLSVHIGTNVEYGIYVEKGTGIYAVGGNGRKGGWVYQDPKDDEWYFTWGQEPQPFLTPAAEDNRMQIKQIFKKYLGANL
jgi:HK97 gp10 family phage protein